MQWKSCRDRRLLAASTGPFCNAAAHFDVFVTRDKQLPFQQNLSCLPLGVVIAVVADNRIESFRQIFDALNRAVEGVRPGEVIWVEGTR